MGPKLKYRVLVPPEAKQVIEDWYAEHDRGEPEKFSVLDFAYLLCHPYEAGISNYEVTCESLISFKVSRSHFGAISIVVKDGQWSVDHSRMIIY